MLGLHATIPCQYCGICEFGRELALNEETDLTRGSKRLISNLVLVTANDGQRLRRSGATPNSTRQTGFHPSLQLENRTVAMVISSWHEVARIALWLLDVSCNAEKTTLSVRLQKSRDLHLARRSDKLNRQTRYRSQCRSTDIKILNIVDGSNLMHARA